MKNKLIIVSFILILLALALVGIIKSNSAIEKTRKSTEETRSIIDSIVTSKIDYRYTSYDGRFMYDNTIVIDEDGKIIGKLLLYTNDKQIDSFYKSDSTFKKTRVYDNLKNGTLRVLKK